jgi:hypothetical protein
MNIIAFVKKTSLHFDWWKTTDGPARAGYNMTWPVWALVVTAICVFINPIKLYWIAAINKYFNMGCMTFRSPCKNKIPTLFIIKAACTCSHTCVHSHTHTHTCVYWVRNKKVSYHSDNISCNIGVIIVSLVYVHGEAWKWGFSVYFL